VESSQDKKDGLDVEKLSDIKLRYRPDPKLMFKSALFIWGVMFCITMLAGRGSLSFEIIPPLAKDFAVLFVCIYIGIYVIVFIWIKLIYGLRWIEEDDKDKYRVYSKFYGVDISVHKHKQLLTINGHEFSKDKHSIYATYKDSPVETIFSAGQVIKRQGAGQLMIKSNLNTDKLEINFRDETAELNRKYKRNIKSIFN